MGEAPGSSAAGESQQGCKQQGGAHRGWESRCTGWGPVEWLSSRVLSRLNEGDYSSHSVRLFSVAVLQVQLQTGANCFSLALEHKIWT